MDSVCSVGKLLKEACHKLSYTRGGNWFKNRKRIYIVMMIKN